MFVCMCQDCRRENGLKSSGWVRATAMHDAEPPSHFGSWIAAVIGATFGAGGTDSIAPFGRRSLRVMVVVGPIKSETVSV